MSVSLYGMPPTKPLVSSFVMTIKRTPTWRHPGAGQARFFATSSRRTAVIDVEEKLHRALQPDMQASQAGGFH
jgi:hypothetical protein